MRSAGAQSSSSYSSHLNSTNDLNTSMQTAVTCDRSFSSLFDTSSTKTSQSKFSNNSAENNSFSHHELPFFGNDSSVDDDDGIFLQISNLDQYYDESSLKNYLMNQLKPITPILSLSIETPSIAKVKVPSIQVSSIHAY